MRYHTCIYLEGLRKAMKQLRIVLLQTEIKTYRTLDGNIQ